MVHLSRLGSILLSSCKFNSFRNLSTQHYHRIGATKILKITNLRQLSSAVTAPSVAPTGNVTNPIPPLSTENTTDKKPEEPSPPKPKETFKEKTRIYFRNLAHDYKDVYFDTIKEAKAKPAKATIYIFLVGGILYCIWSNPGEQSYFANFIASKEDLELVAKPIRNPDSESYVHEIQKLRMKGLLRYQSLGLLSIIWRHNEDASVANYDAQCSYLKPLYSEIIWERLVDVGVFNQWWILKDKMTDFDINYTEWQNSGTADSQESKSSLLSSMLNKQ